MKVGDGIVLELNIQYHTILLMPGEDSAYAHVVAQSHFMYQCRRKTREKNITNNLYECLHQLKVLSTSSSSLL